MSADWSSLGTAGWSTSSNESDGLSWSATDWSSFRTAAWSFSTVKPTNPDGVSPPGCCDGNGDGGCSGEDNTSLAFAGEGEEEDCGEFIESARRAARSGAKRRRNS